MKKLVLNAILLGGLAQLATGCLIVGDDGGDPPPPPVETGAIDVAWSLVAGDANAPTDCPPEAPFAAVYYEDSLNDQYVDLFNCVDFAGLSQELFPDAYFTWVELHTEAEELWAASEGQLVDVFVDTNTEAPIFEFSVDRGAFFIDWEIQDGGVAITCEDALATEFALDSTYNATNELENDYFPCTDYEGRTDVLALGEWSVVPSIIDDTQLAIASGDSIDDSLLYGNDIRDLGTVILDLQAP